jgi:membrane-associated protein
MLAVNWLDAHSLIASFSTIGVILIIFAETGLLIGVFLPGDSLLVTAGIAAGGGLGGVHLPLWALLIGCPLAAVIGAQVGYLIGHHTGPVLFRREDARIFRQEYVDRASAYLERFGARRAVFLARFVPIVRTFLNPLCGIVVMPQRVFFVWNAIGGVVWTTGIIMLGYIVGRSVSHIDRYILPGIAVIVVLSLLPILREIRKGQRASKNRAA